MCYQNSRWFQTVWIIYLLLKTCHSFCSKWSEMRSYNLTGWEERQFRNEKSIYMLFRFLHYTFKETTKWCKNFHHFGLSLQSNCTIFKRQYRNIYGVFWLLCCGRHFREDPPELFLGKTCSENMQQIYRRTSMPKCDFNHRCFPVNLLHMFRTPFDKSTPERPLLTFWSSKKIQRCFFQRGIPYRLNHSNYMIVF